MPIRYGDWPTRSAPELRVTENRQKLVEGCRTEVVALKTGHRGRGRSWTRIRLGYVYCSLRVCNKLMPVDHEGHLGAVVDSVEEAIEWYEKTVLEIEAGEYDERIKQLLASIPARKKRTGGESHDD